MLADALATDVQWDVQYEVVSSNAFQSEWASRVGTVLHALPDFDTFIAATDAAGYVGVHAARSSTGLTVVSVIAEPSIPAARVHRAAHDVAELVLYRSPQAERLSLFDLPLGDGHAWTITERHEVRDGRGESVGAVLPAWEASKRCDLMTAPNVGMRDAVAVFVHMVSPEWSNSAGQAVQEARAEYTAWGFRAAAITVLGEVAGEAGVPELCAVRDATLRFDRPYAVVAVARAGRTARSVPPEALPWHRIPVFSAWVAQPTEASG